MRARPRRRPDWLAIALGTAAGFLAGVVLLVGLGVGAGDGAARTVTVTRTSPAAPRTSAGALIRETTVPDVVGERLDIAKERIKRTGFVVDVQGGGLFGVVVDSHWQVAAQEPTAGGLLELGSTVHVNVERR